ncbi:MAG: hypothetical protein M5R41_09370 [Bacteroidia bacterium]|nr:hypothetical protein [Bacteroidia bacterium]
MTRASRYTALTILLLTAMNLHSLKSQDISRYSVSDGGELFKREVQQALRTAAGNPALPRLDCAVEYLRRDTGNEIVYRRGPIELHLSGIPTKESGTVSSGGAPASAEQAPPNFLGGMLLDLPRAGETTEDLALNPDGHRYMLRVAIVPESYAASVLRARVILERAVVIERGDSVRVINSEVFSRPVELEGNLPLKFDLPPWDALASDGRPLLPTALSEAVLLTLETPRHFALAPNFPEPFNGRTLISYAVPTQSYVRLAIRLQGEEQVLDEGQREAGVYDVAWNSGNIPDGNYTAVLEAQNANGAALYRDERPMTKSASVPDMAQRPSTVSSVPSVTAALYPQEYKLFSAGIESGLSYQFPADQAKGFRNMFTHMAFRAGMRVTRWMEVGIVAGQDAFHEYPANNVDIEKISDFGGVVAWTYGYAGPYVRLLASSGALMPFVQASAVWSDAAAGAEVTAGLRAALLPQIEAYIGPSLFSHFRSEVSTKVGLHYGMTVRF